MLRETSDNKFIKLMSNGKRKHSNMMVIICQNKQKTNWNLWILQESDMQFVFKMYALSWEKCTLKREIHVRWEKYMYPESNFKCTLREIQCTLREIHLRWEIQTIFKQKKSNFCSMIFLEETIFEKIDLFEKTLLTSTRTHYLLLILLEDALFASEQENIFRKMHW